MALPAEAYAEIWDVMRVAYPRVQQPSGLQFGGVSRVDSSSPAPKRATYQGPPSVVRDGESVDEVAAKLRDLINRAPRRIAAFDSTGHRRAADLALSELTGFARRALDDAAVHLAHAAVLKLSDQASYDPAQDAAGAESLDDVMIRLQNAAIAAGDSMSSHAGFWPNGVVVVLAPLAAELTAARTRKSGSNPGQQRQRPLARPWPSAGSSGLLGFDTKTLWQSKECPSVAKADADIREASVVEAMNERLKVAATSAAWYREGRKHALHPWLVDREPSSAGGTEALTGVDLPRVRDTSLQGDRDQLNGVARMLPLLFMEHEGREVHVPRSAASDEAWAPVLDKHPKARSVVQKFKGRAKGDAARTDALHDASLYLCSIVLHAIDDGHFSYPRPAEGAGEEELQKYCGKCEIIK